MKFTAATLASMAAVVAALPADIKYGPPPGGWDSIDWSKINYPKGTGENLPHYDAPKGGWDSVDYSKVDWSKIDWSKVDYSKVDWSKVNYGSNTPPAPKAATPAPKPEGPSGPRFTTSLEVHATPDQVTQDSGLKDAYGVYRIDLNSQTNTICYNITLYGFGTNEYYNKGVSATHLNQAPKGKTGNIRVAFKNPEVIGNGLRRSADCLTGPFTTGIQVNGVDSGKDFNVRDIELKSTDFYVEALTTNNQFGAIRGQFA